MYVSITIRYSSPAGVVLQQGDFPLKGKGNVDVAVKWWREIRSIVFADDLLEVIANGDEDITEKVKEALLR